MKGNVKVAWMASVDNVAKGPGTRGSSLPNVVISDINILGGAIMTNVHAALLGLVLLGAPALPAEQAPRPSASQTAAPGQSTAKRVTREEAVKDAGSLKRYANIALLVGIGDYDRSLTGLPALKYPVPDITSIGGVLKQQGYDVALLTDRSATAGTIREAFSELAKALDPGEGTFLFYFSGHGFRAGTENYLATFGVKAADLAHQGLSLAEVQKLLSATGAKRRMAFIDACRNDPESTRSVTTPRSFLNLKESEGLRILYSTAPGEVSYEDEDLQHGVFSYFMWLGLSGKAANSADGMITFDDLRDYVTREMRSYGIAKRRVQKPYQLGDSTGDFLLAQTVNEPAKAPVTATVSAAVQQPQPPATVDRRQPAVTPPPAGPPNTDGADTKGIGIGGLKDSTGSLDALPQVWRNVVTNQLYRMRFDTDHLIIYQIEGNQVVADLALKHDKKDSKKVKYVGTTSISRCEGGYMEVLSWSPTRIEARIEVPDTQNQCGGLIVSFLRSMASASFIPETPARK